MASIRGLIIGERLLMDGPYMPVDGDWEPVDADWLWDDRDPLVIALRFPTARVTWTIARQLLAEGLRRKAGSGDVIVGPHGDAVLLHLAGRGGRALLRFNATEVQRFITATYEAIDDTEAATVVRNGVDTLLRGLFGQGSGGHR